MKAMARQWFGEQVRNLIIGGYVAHEQLTGSYTFADKVEVDLHVFAAGMENWICRNISCPKVVTPEFWRRCLWAANFREQGLYPNDFCSKSGESLVLSFSRGSGNRALLAGRPRN
ncbi:unnamed protein product [Linum trigynum]|uniref:Uncharacterized protein n=1 Tax=Linum trigynum TaxID=586398 RepID=A0AAV2FQG0_9ROSI